MAAAGKAQKDKSGFLHKFLDQEKPIEVDKWDGNAVKNALDDVVRKVFTETLGYVEKHIYIDIRLALSFLGCAIALSALAYDYMFPYPQSKYVVLTCVITYFTLMSILTLFTAFVEKNYILIAAEKDKAGLDPDNTWKIATSLRRYDHMYHIMVQYEDGKTKKSKEVEMLKSVSEWFDENGLLLSHKFETEIKNIQSGLCGEKKDQ